MSSSKRAPFFADLFAVWTLGGTISIGRLDRF
jgi:hypothetical protein